MSSVAQFSRDDDDGTADSGEGTQMVAADETDLFDALRPPPTTQSTSNSN